MIPPLLAAAVRRLKFENPSDERFALAALNDREYTQATLAWLTALIKRKGVRYDDNNPAHHGPTELDATLLA